MKSFFSQWMDILGDSHNCENKPVAKIKICSFSDLGEENMYAYERSWHFVIWLLFIILSIHEEQQFSTCYLFNSLFDKGLNWDYKVNCNNVTVKIRSGGRRKYRVWSVYVLKNMK